MTSEFKPIPDELYKSVESHAGEIVPPLTGRLKNRRPRERFDPDWEYLLSGNASVEAVVAGLRCGTDDVPERIYERAVQLYCPRAWEILTRTGQTFHHFYIGKLEVGSGAEVAAVANAELGGYAVFHVADIPAMVAAIIAGLGTVPTFAPE